MSSKSSDSRACTGNGGSTDMMKAPALALEAVCGGSGSDISSSSSSDSRGGSA